jgi:hypothetical protein
MYHWTPFMVLHWSLVLVISHAILVMLVNAWMIVLLQVRSLLPSLILKSLLVNVGIVRRILCIKMAKFVLETFLVLLMHFHEVLLDSLSSIRS